MNKVNKDSNEAKLWQIIDDIDTFSDQIKPTTIEGYKRYFEAVNGMVGARFMILQSDGYNLFKEQGSNTMRQYDDQETELATHFSGNNNRFYIRGHSMVKKAMVLNNDGHWIYGDCTRNDELDGGEFWKLDGKQVLSEDWLIDQLTDKPTLEQQEKAATDALREDYDKGMRKCVKDIAKLVGCNFGGDIGYENLASVVAHVINGTSQPQESTCSGVRIGSPVEPYEWTEKHDEQLKSALIRVEQLNKPVFTQEMAKAKQLAPIGSKITYHTSPRDDEGVTATVIGHHNEWMWILTDSGRFDQITMDVTFSFPDNRSDKEKLKDEIYKQIVTPHIPDTYLDDVIDSLVNAGKFTITLNK